MIKADLTVEMTNRCSALSGFHLTNRFLPNRDRLSCDLTSLVMTILGFGFHTDSSVAVQVAKSPMGAWGVGGHASIPASSSSGWLVVDESLEAEPVGQYMRVLRLEENRTFLIFCLAETLNSSRSSSPMSVLFETSLGDLVVDLEVELCPRTCENFLKLCKTYYYNFCSFFNVQKDFIAQTGDPTDLGTGGESIYARLERAEGRDPEYYGKRYFPSELGVQKGNQKWLNHGRRGTLSMAVAEGKCGSQFFLTLVDGLNELDSKHVVFGRLVEGLDTLEKINEVLVDDQGRPLRDIRLRHVIVLDDPFPDPSGLTIPSQSPIEPPAHQHEEGKKILRVGDDEELDEEQDPEVVEERRREREARAQALTLEMVGDLPFAEVSPPENILFVCKLNAITRSEDLELIFSRFGTILSCQVITDPKTGDSLQYAFIEFLEQEDAERAYFKMDGVLIDDRRIHVDFSQSVSKLHSDWVYKRTGKRQHPDYRPNKNPSSRTARDSKYEKASMDHGGSDHRRRQEDHPRQEDRRRHDERRHDERRHDDRRHDDRRHDDRRHDDRRQDDHRPHGSSSRPTRRPQDSNPHGSRHDHSRRRSRSPATRTHR